MLLNWMICAGISIFGNVDKVQRSRICASGAYTNLYYRFYFGTVNFVTVFQLSGISVLEHSLCYAKEAHCRRVVANCEYT